jgi:hypothetical protein
MSHPSTGETALLDPSSITAECHDMTKPRRHAHEHSGCLSFDKFGNEPKSSVQNPAVSQEAQSTNRQAGRVCKFVHSWRELEQQDRPMLWTL